MSSGSEEKKEQPRRDIITEMEISNCGHLGLREKKNPHLVTGKTISFPMTVRILHISDQTGTQSPCPFIVGVFGGDRTGLVTQGQSCEMAVDDQVRAGSRSHSKEQFLTEKM